MTHGAPGAARAGGAVIVLHSHLPYVLGHGVWPHGEHWLMELGAECYLPLLGACRRLHGDGLKNFLTIGFTPVLAAQLADSRFPSLFDSYLRERRRQALEDAAIFGRLSPADERRDLALAWAAEFERTRRTFAEELDGDIMGAWRELQDAGAVEVLTSALTHGYLPLVLNDLCAWGQVRGGAAVYEWLFGRAPRGMWLPECAYRPRYVWSPPIGGPPRLRAGVEELLEAASLEYFVADAHLLEQARRSSVDLRGDPDLERLYGTFRAAFAGHNRTRRPGYAYRVRTLGGRASRVSVLARQHGTGTRVWNRDVGYPGNPEYLDFAKQHQGGLRYWRVTDRHGPIEAKALYDRQAALRRAHVDAADFAGEVLRLGREDGLPLVIGAYDTELFGHWWREGPVWLEQVVRDLAAGAAGPLTIAEALRAVPPVEAIPLPEGSWGEGGFHWVWFNWMTRELWTEIYACESDFAELVGQLAGAGLPRAGLPEGGLGAVLSGDGRTRERQERVLSMLGQELVLVESSDWPFLVTGGPAREYARQRLLLHVERFGWLRDRLFTELWTEEDERRLRAIELQDRVFPNLELAWWSELPAPIARLEGTLWRDDLKLRVSPRLAGWPARFGRGARPAVRSGGFEWTAAEPGGAWRQAEESWRVLHVASEGLPFSKTGGLADVLGALPAALARLGLEIVVVLPAHMPMLPGAPAVRRTNRSVIVELGRGSEYRFEILEAKAAGVRYLLLAHSGFFERSGVYAGPDGHAYDDNWLRFAAFAKAAGELAAVEGFELVHCHDWQAALLPVFETAGDGETGRPPRFQTVLTIHNVVYQGEFPASIWHELGLPHSLFRPDGLEFYGKVNYLKGGILFADALATVSPTYAKEILTSEQGAGLEGVLRTRRDRLTGILNGVDYSEWDPSVDRFIARPYGPYDLRGKALCKAELQDLLGLERDPDAPLAGVVSRLAGQKGWDLLLDVLPRFVEAGVQLVVLGSGETRFENGLRGLARTHAGRVGIRIGFDEKLAHKIEAGADLFLMPSRYEPCGLNQMYSLRYGTVPVVRATGGLADTVIDASVSNGATGYVFHEYSVKALERAIERALQGYGSERWREIQRRGMLEDFSWSVSAAAYLELYRRLAAESGAEVTSRAEASGRGAANW